ncbi:hypothetical protein RI054_06g34660 [Pseudoscourfieldia marina]
MTNYKYAETFRATSTSGTIALELILDLDPDDDNAIIIPDIIRRTNERASLHDRIIRANPKTADAALHYPCKGAAVAVTAAARVARRPQHRTFRPARHNRRAKMQTSTPHTHDTPMCYAPGGARHDQHVGAATPTQAAEVAVDEADIKVARRTRRTTPAAYTPQPQHYTPQQHQNFQLGGAYTTYPAYPVLAADASHHGIGGTQQYLPPPPPLPSRLMRTTLHE